MNIIQFLQNLIQNPYSPKNYRDIQKYYSSIGMTNEAEAFSILVKQHEHDHSPTDEKQ